MVIIGEYSIINNMNNYQYTDDVLLRKLSAIKKDLDDGQITEKEFDFLISLLLKKQVNDFIKERVKSFLPQEKRTELTLISYARNQSLGNI